MADIIIIIFHAMNKEIIGNYTLLQYGMVYYWCECQNIILLTACRSMHGFLLKYKYTFIEASYAYNSPYKYETQHDAMQVNLVSMILKIICIDKTMSASQYSILEMSK